MTTTPTYRDKTSYDAQVEALQVSVQRLEALEHRDRHEEVPPRITDKPFDFTFVVALAGVAEPIDERKRFPVPLCGET